MTQELLPLPSTILALLQERPASGRLSEPVFRSLLQPKPQGERTDTMKRIVGHYCALGETRAAAKQILTWWNERNDPPLEADEFEYQFDSMWQRWGSPRETLTLEESVQAIELLPESQRTEALIHALDDRRLSRLDYALWRERLKQQFGLPKSTFDSLVRRALVPTEDAPNPQSPVEVSGTRRESALELLKDPGLLHRVLQMLKRLGLVREESNALVVYLAATSRLVEDPINTTFQGDPSSGKSYTVLSVLSLIPNEEKIVRLGFSTQALIYSTLDFRHKVICVLEHQGTEQAKYSIRTMQSEKFITFEVTVKGDDSRFTTQIVTKEGPAAFITTTVELKLDPQDESRNWMLQSDDSAEQSWKVVESMVRRHVVPEEEQAVFIDAQRLLSRVSVAYPEELLEALYQGIRRRIAEPPPRVRRDFMRLREAIRTSACLHQYQRGVTEDGEVMPDIRDYYMVWRACQGTFDRSLMPQRKHQLMEVVEAVRKAFEEKEEPIGQADVINITGWSKFKVSRWMNRAIEYGLVSEEYRFRYVPATARQGTPGGMLEDITALPPPNEVANSLEIPTGLVIIDPITGEPLETIE